MIRVPITLRNPFIHLLLLVFTTAGVVAQDPVALRYGDQVSTDLLRENLTILASDAMEGRETGKRGQKMAAAFIKNHFEELGLQGPAKEGYYQPVPLYKLAVGKTYVTDGSRQYKHLKEVVYHGSADSNGEVQLPLVFAGLGREKDFETLDVDGKAVLLRVEGNRFFNVQEVGRARQRGARIVLLWVGETDEDFSKFIDLARQDMSGARPSLTRPRAEALNSGLFFVPPSVATSLMKMPKEKLLAAAKEDPEKKALRKVKPVSFSYQVEMLTATIKTENVLGYLEGTDKKDELLIITAHYDHIGRTNGSSGDVINNGADDDGSGTVAVMEMARLFAQAKQEGAGPRRSILFMTVTGEEKGLLGSEFYVQNPVFPLSATVVNLNADMIGRRDPQHKDNDRYVYVIGSDKLSSALHALSERVNTTYTRLDFDYTYNDTNHPERLYYRSDHWNFAKNNIPIIFYFDGIHEDYHQVSDEVDKIEFELLRKRVQCIFYTAWEIANQESRIKPD